MKTRCFAALSVPLMLVQGCVLPLVKPVDPAAGRDLPPVSISDVVEGTAYERFIVIGDMGTGSSDQKAVAAAMVTRAGAAENGGLDFLLTVGDNFYPFGVSSTTDAQWQTKFEQIYADPVFDVPVYAVLGNHDHYGSIGAQIAYTNVSSRWQMPAAYYSFTRTLPDGTEVAFFALDTTPIEANNGSTNEQLAWLDQQLAATTAHWKFVLGHHHLYGNGPRGNDEGMISRLKPLFDKYGVDLYICGHEHMLELHKPVDGVNYVISGAAGGPDKAYNATWDDADALYVATLGGFVYARISADELVLEFVRMNGKAQFAYTVTK